MQMRAIMLGVFLGASLVCAQISTDGTTGDPFIGAVSLPGPDFEIGPDLGTVAGPNIFFSFSEFNLGANEGAFFHGEGETTLTGIDRVISRVTGGNLSTINGFVESGFEGADFYFINPAGISLGPNAEFTIDGSLYISTADHLSLADGGRFDASTPANTLLTSAPPSAFGFLSANPGSLQIQDSFRTVGEGPQTFVAPRIFVPSGETLAFIAGDITIANSVLQLGPIPPNIASQLEIPLEEAAEIAVASVASPGDVSIHPLALKAIETTPGMQGGNLTIDFSRIQNDAASQDGVGISIFAGDALIDGSILNNNTSSTGSPRGIDIDVTGTLTVSDSSLTAAAVFDAQANGGTISIDADHILVNESSIFRVETLDTANAGNLVINATTDIVIDSGLLSGHTVGTGDGANMSLSAPTIRLLNNASVSASSIAGLGGSAGNGGNISFTADLSEVRSGASIGASSFAHQPGGANTGAVGNVSFDTTDLVLDGTAFISMESRASGDGGALTIRADRNVHLLNGAEIRISNHTTVSTAGSSIDIEAQDIIFQGIPSVKGGPASSIRAIASESGNGGDIRLEADTILFTDRGGISAPTTGSGDASTSHIIAHDSFIMEGELSGIFSGAPGAGPGPGPARPPTATRGDSGRVIIDAGDIIMRDLAEIVSSTSVSTDAGDIEIRADSLELRGGIIKSSSEEPDAGLGGRIIMELDELRLVNGGRIQTNTSSDSNAGVVLIAANTIDIQGNSLISTSAGEAARSGDEPGAGQGGRLFLNGNSITVAGEVSSSTQSNGGRAGRLRIGDLPDDILSSADPIDLADLALFNAVDFVAIYNAFDLVQLDVLSGGLITSASSGQGDARSIAIESQNLLVDGGKISTEIQGAGTGSAADASITITTDSFEMRDGTITSEAFSNAGDAGDVLIQSSGHLAVTGGKISSASASAGAAGQVSLIGASIEARADIQTTVVGTQGVARASILLQSTTGDLSVTGGRISASTVGPADAGTISISSGQNFRLQDGGIVSNSSSTGNAGTIAITAANDFNQTRGEISSKGEATGNAGQISLLATGNLDINSGRVESSSTGSGDAGQVEIQGTEIRFKDATISTAASGTGDTSNAHVLIGATDNFEMHGGMISTAASDPNAGGGEIYIAAGLPETVNPAGNLTIRDAIIRADSLGDGGNIYLFAPQIITITDSEISASAGKDGGNIAIGDVRPSGGRAALVIAKPLCVILQRSILNGVAGGQPVKVRISSGHFLNAQNTILTDTPPTVPDANTVEGLIVFEPPPMTVADLLQNRCSVKLPGSISSFIIAGPGGMPIDSDWLLPGFVDQ